MRHTVRAIRPMYELTDFTTLLLARVSTLQPLKTLHNVCFAYVLIYDFLRCLVSILFCKFKIVTPQKIIGISSRIVLKLYLSMLDRI